MALPHAPLPIDTLLQVPPQSPWDHIALGSSPILNSKRLAAAKAYLFCRYPR